jgi:hypothetical protein
VRIVDDGVWSKEVRGSSQQIRACWVAALSGAPTSMTQKNSQCKTMTHRVLPSPPPLIPDRGGDGGGVVMAYARLHQVKLRMADHTVVSEDEWQP